MMKDDAMDHMVDQENADREENNDNKGSNDDNEVRDDHKKAEKLLRSFSGVDAGLVERSASFVTLQAQKKQIYRKTLAAAAVLAVVVLGGLGIYHVRFDKEGLNDGMESRNIVSMMAMDQAETVTENQEEMLLAAGNEANEEEALEADTKAVPGDENDGQAKTDSLQADFSSQIAAQKMEEGRSDDDQGSMNTAAKSSYAADMQSAEQEENSRQAQAELLSLEGKFTETQNWGLSFGESGTQPRGNVPAEEMKPFNAYYMGSADEKVIYLTFDCGYENGYAPMILDTLKEHNVKVTFFVVGPYIKYNEDIVRRMVEEGHNVGNHSYTHPDMSQILTEEGFREEMEGVSDLFEERIGGKMTTFYRPPQGKFNWANLEMANRLGYYTIFWSLAHVDWDVENQPDPAATIEKLNSRIHPGAIVLLHIISKTNAEILDELLTDWENMGYRFGTLNELCGVG